MSLGRDMLTQQAIQYAMKLLGLDTEIAPRLQSGLEFLESLNSRLRRIEAALGIDPEQPPSQTVEHKALTNGTAQHENPGA